MECCSQAKSAIACRSDVFTLIFRWSYETICAAIEKRANCAPIQSVERANAATSKRASRTDTWIKCFVVNQNVNATLKNDASVTVNIVRPICSKQTEPNATKDRTCTVVKIREINSQNSRSFFLLCVDRGYCYNQFCFGNTTDYCRSYFNDPNAKVAEDKMNLNTKADPMHNCGWPAQDSLPSECAIENVQCGSMHCQLSQRFVNATQTYSIGYHGPGNVLFARPFPDGVKCKTDHLCIDNECLPRQSLPQMACPDDCNNAGRCVYGGHCYCNPEQDYNDPVSCYNTFLLRWNDIAIIIVITSMVIVSIAIMISRCRQSVNAEKQKMAAEMRREARSKSSTKTKPRSGRRNRATTNQKPSSKLSAPRTTANAPETPVAAAPVPTPAPARPNVFVDQPTSSPVKKSNYILQMFNKKKTIGSGLAEEAFVPLSKKSKTITTVDSCT